MPPHPSAGPCLRSFHLRCLKLPRAPPSSWECDDCRTDTHECFLCGEKSRDTKKCQVPSCGKFYHMACVREQPRTRLQNDSFSCPVRGSRANAVGVLPALVSDRVVASFADPQVLQVPGDSSYTRRCAVHQVPPVIPRRARSHRRLAVPNPQAPIQVPRTLLGRGVGGAAFRHRRVGHQRCTPSRAGGSGRETRADTLGGRQRCRRGRGLAPSVHASQGLPLHATQGRPAHTSQGRPAHTSEGRPAHTSQGRPQFESCG